MPRRQGRRRRGRGWSPLGRALAWDEAYGPGRAVRRASLAHPGAGWTLAVKHVEAVWGMCYSTASRGGLDPEPLEFAAKLARHVLDCGYCQRPEVMAVWEKALPYTLTTDIVRAIQKGNQ